MRKKKVLFVINTLGCAGAEKALLELLKEFSKEEYEVSLYVLLNQGELISQIPQYVKVFGCVSSFKRRKEDVKPSDFLQTFSKRSGLQKYTIFVEKSDANDKMQKSVS